MRQNDLFLGDSSAHLCLARRLGEELAEAAREFLSNPKQYFACAVKGASTGDARHVSLMRLGFAVGVLVYALFFLAIIILWSIGGGRPVAQMEKALRVIHMPDHRVESFEMGQSEREARGGGGGGDNSSTPHSKGQPPPFAFEPSVIAPTTKTPRHPPLLALDMNLLGDPAHNLKRDELMPVGLPDGVDGPPSDGTGTNDGMGTGNQRGAGPGTGPGFGPGEKGGYGGGTYSLGGKPREKYEAEKVDSYPVPLNYPRPLYTEEARKNKLQGVVRARVLVGSDGLVKQVKIVRGLADGLNEQAIAAALQMRFKPATRSGQAVAHWTTLDVEFNLR